MAKLVCQTGPTAGHEYPLTKDVTTMGRQSSCDVQILDNMSSRVNCQVRRDGKLFTLVDLGSRNGTNLNGKKVTERQLTFGDRIRIGEAEYLFVKEPGDVELRDLLSKYEVQEKLGEGGMGIVYKANQRSMNRIVALKILSPKYSSRPRFVEQFIREARAAGQLNHPNIIQVHDVGTENDIHYFSMEFVDGPTCMQALRQHGPFKTADALEIIRQTAKALEYAHSQRLIHQDIKPDNIMLGNNNTVKLADLGISKTFDEAEAEEGPKRVMGTPHYMAPEAALGKKIDHRVDIYSLGATLYHLLTGKTPYSGTSATEVLKAHVMDPLPPIHDMVADVPEAVCALVERMVAKKPEDRYPTATQIIEEVQRLQTGLGLGTERIGGGETMLLRKFAASNATGGALTPAAATTGTRTPQGVDERAMTSDRPLRRPAKRSYETFIFIGIVVVLIIGAIHFLGNSPISEESTTGEHLPTTQRDTGPATPTETDQPINDPAQQRHLLALAGIEEQLKGNPEQINLDVLRQQVDELMGDKLGKEDKEHAMLLKNRIAAMMQTKNDLAVEQDYTSLKAEVVKLIADHNYDIARNRLDTFKHKDKSLVKDRVATLHADIEREKDSYLANLKSQIAFAKAAKDIRRLKELDAQLPPPLIKTDIETEITSAITALEADVSSHQQEVLAQAALELSHWNFSGLDDVRSSARTSMGDTPAGKQLDAYCDAAHRLSLLPTAMQEQLKNKDINNLPLYHGTLNSFTDPNIFSADERGLQLQVGGASATLGWPEIPPEGLLIIAKLVLPKDEVEQYRSAIELLATVKSATKKNK